MLRQRAVLALLLVAAALATPAQGGTPEDPELTDAAGDQAVDGPTSGLPGGVAVPVLGDDEFADIDLQAAWFEEPTGGCAGQPAAECPELTLVVRTGSGWAGGTLAATFRLERGPTSYARSNASGQQVAVTVVGTAVTGVANASADAGADGLRIHLPLAALGAVGGDLATNLTLEASRTDPGPVTDPQVTQDDTTGTDTAGPGDPYTFRRPTPVADIEVDVVSIDGRAGASATPEGDEATVRLVVSNLGTDDDAFTLAVASDPPLRDPPVLAAVQTALPAGGQANVTVPISLAGMDARTVRVTFTATSGRGASDQAVATFTRPTAPAAAREVVPEGLDFLTPAAEATGLDGAFGRFAELALLALLVLLAILAVFLLVALAPSTLAGAPAPEAPALAKAGEAAPAAVLPAMPAANPRADPAPEEPPAEPGAAAAAATKGGALAIESVTHEPAEPEEGEQVTSEAVLRNPGPTRKVRVVLSLDGADVDEAPVTLPARAAKTVRLRWTAGPGDNRVKVRVLPA